MSQILESVNRFRADLLAGERQAASALVQTYGQVWERIRLELDSLLEKMAQARANGETINRAWLRKRDRLQTLKAQVEREVGYFARNTEWRILQEQTNAIDAARRQTRQLVLESLGEPPPGVVLNWNALPTKSFTDLVGTLQDGSPLRTLLDELPMEASKAVERELLTGLALGKNPREIAKRIRGAMGMQLTRALRISRNEVLRSYRTASLRSYQENADVVDSWIWVAALSGRTCPVCLSMHGKEFPLDVPFSSHVCCRCAAVPKTKTWKELGFDVDEETALEVEEGAAWIARQEAGVQDGILGKDAGKAYREGKVTLEDFVRVRNSEAWGKSRSVRSLDDALIRAQTRKNSAKA